jgi:hypothetical protein
MSESKMYIPKLSDQTLIDTLKKISEMYGDKGNCNAYVGNINIPIEFKLLSIEAQKVYDSNSIMITRMTFHVKDFSFSLTRDKSPMYDEVSFNTELSGQNERMTNLQKIEVIGMLAHDLKAFDPKRTISGLMSPEQNQMFALHEANLERLEKLNESLVKDSESFRNKLEQQYFDKKQKLDDEQRVRKDGLIKEYQRKDEELNTKTKKLNEKIAEFDDRENTHVRRKLREAILEEVKKRTQEFKLTEGTRKLRLPINIIFIVLIVIMIVGAIFSTKQLFGINSNASPQLFLMLSLRSTTLAIAVVTMAIFYIRWLNKWFEQHAQAEFQLKQFQLDIERASWLVETSLEWNDKKGSSMPKELLESLTPEPFFN